MTSRRTYVLFLIILLTSCLSKNRISVEEVVDFYQDQGLENIESALYDDKHHVLYLSNGQDYRPGKDGFISRVSPDGSFLDLKWISDLNRPTGMALKGDTLWIADVFVLLAIDTESGKVLARYNEPKLGSGLNDVAIGPEGNVYVTASAAGAVYRLINGTLEPWVQDKVQLKYANGIVALEDQIIVAGFNLTRIDRQSGQLTDLLIQPAIKDFEGIVSDGNGGYFLTTVTSSGLYHLKPDLSMSALLEGPDFFGDLCIEPERNLLYIPRGNEATGQSYLTRLDYE